MTFVQLQARSKWTTGSSRLDRKCQRVACVWLQAKPPMVPAPPLSIRCRPIRYHWPRGHTERVVQSTGCSVCYSKKAPFQSDRAGSQGAHWAPHRRSEAPPFAKAAARPMRLLRGISAAVCRRHTRQGRHNALAAGLRCTRPAPSCHPQPGIHHILCDCKSGSHASCRPRQKTPLYAV